MALLAPIILRWLPDFWTPGIKYILVILDLWTTSRKMEEKIAEYGAYNVFSLPNIFRAKTRTVS
jgi:hypothetical protein